MSTVMITNCERFIRNTKCPITFSRWYSAMRCWKHIVNHLLPGIWPAWALVLKASRWSMAPWKWIRGGQIWWFGVGFTFGFMTDSEVDLYPWITVWIFGVTHHKDEEWSMCWVSKQKATTMPPIPHCSYSKDLKNCVIYQSSILNMLTMEIAISLDMPVRVTLRWGHSYTETL